MKNEFEIVFSYEWYDGPMNGVANRNGTPYYFEYQAYNENGKDVYYLSPIDETILKLAIESWKIWKNWDIAFHEKRVDENTHPYLPEDKKRGKEINEILKNNLKIDPSNFVELDAEFKLKDEQNDTLGMKYLMVRWINKK